MISLRVSLFFFLALASSSWMDTSWSDDPARELPYWIWVSEKASAEEKIYFREVFEIPNSAERVVLVAAADNQIDIHVNGARRPARTGDWTEPIVEDITDQIQRGEPNLLAGRASNQGGDAAFFVLLEITHQDGTKSRVVSSSGWNVSRRAEKGWNQPGYESKQARWESAVSLGKIGVEPWDKISEEVIEELLELRGPEATAVEGINLPDGFSAELLYSVPKATQGSWVAMTLDDKQRLIVSDQYGSLYRVEIPPLTQTVNPGDVEKIPVDIGGAQGLLYAFDSLYVVQNTSKHGGRGLYRVTDTDGDGQFDTKKLLRKFEEVGGEHGPHAVVLGPDKKSLYIVVGNQTPVTEIDSSRIPQIWGEDLLLPRPYGRGFMKGTLAPGGWVAKTDPEGKSWELIATGFRNQYDAAFNREGELFTFDADMEWDMNTPWYRPTRVNHIVSGAEFGWRNGGGKWPAYYPDSVPGVVDIGPGSPTGVTFGYGAKFPPKYEEALYVADWSYGKLYAVHLSPSGASYTATFEEFMSAQPLPITDLVVNPDDGALYVAIGGRRVQSGLYRVTYQGQWEEAEKRPGKSALHQLRRDLEKYHKPADDAVDFAWPYLAHEDRFIRYAARTAIEHQPADRWDEKALAEANPEARIQASIALARVRAKQHQSELLAGLREIPLNELSGRQRLELFRAFSLIFSRLGRGEREDRERVAEHLSSEMPYESPALNREALQLLVYLEHSDAAQWGIDLLSKAPSQEEQMSYAKSLRHLQVGWTRDLRKRFFEWFTRAKGYKGGASFSLFVGNMKKDALANTPDSERIALKDKIEAEPASEPVFAAVPRSFVKAWSVEDFDDVIHVGLEGNRDFENGRKMFGATTCFACHRFNEEGGAIGPDLTSVSGKFGPRDLLESIVDPSKEISDQYGQMIFTMNDGSIFMGRIMNLTGDTVKVNTNMMIPDEVVVVDRKRLASMKESPISMMPPGLLNTLEKDDVLDLLAYLISKGNPEDPLFAE